MSRLEFVKRLDVVRDDRGRKRKKPTLGGTPYLRLAATDDNRVSLTGLGAAVEFNATVYEPGVLFLRAARFHLALDMLPDGPMVTIQANDVHLAFGDVRFPMENADMLLYPDPVKAPLLHPGDRLRAEESREAQLEQAKHRVEHAKERLLLAAKGVVEAQTELERIQGEPVDTRAVLRMLLEKAMTKR